MRHRVRALRVSFFLPVPSIPFPLLYSRSSSKYRRSHRILVDPLPFFPRSVGWISDTSSQWRWTFPPTPPGRERERESFFSDGMDRRHPRPPFVFYCTGTNPTPFVEPLQDHRGKSRKITGVNDGCARKENERKNMRRTTNIQVGVDLARNNAYGGPKMGGSWLKRKKISSVDVPVREFDPNRCGWKRMRSNNGSDGNAEAPCVPKIVARRRSPGPRRLDPTIRHPEKTNRNRLSTGVRFQRHPS